METTGQRIRATREKKGISQVALARAVGIKPPSLSEIERGETKRPSGEVLVKIAHSLGVTPDYLLTGKIGAASPDGRLLIPVTLREELCVELFKKLTQEEQEELLNELRSKADAHRVLAKVVGGPVKKHAKNARIEQAYGLPDHAKEEK